MWKVIKYVFLGMLVFLLLNVVCAGCDFASWFATKSVEVVKQEVDPHVLLKKYMWFKEASAVLDQKNADISVYENRMKQMKEEYGGDKRKEWTREDREQYNVWSSEVAGVKASFNLVASEYNAKMSEINWAFCNVGMLPQGANKVLPREYKPYITN